MYMQSISNSATDNNQSTLPFSKSHIRKVVVPANVVEKSIALSSNPSVRVAFHHKLDSDTQAIQDQQYVVQYFYENRIAALERYVAFCVIFHSMAAFSSDRRSYNTGMYNCLCDMIGVDTNGSLWDIARSQSNLRIATTGMFPIFIFQYLAICLYSCSFANFCSPT